MYVVYSKKPICHNLIQTKNFLGVVQNLRWQDDVVLEISAVSRFTLITVEEFIYQCQPGVAQVGGQ